MTEEHRKIWDAKKLSRTWRVVVYWLAILPICLVAQIVLTALGSGVSLPLEIIAGGTLTASGAYMGKRAVDEWAHRNHGDK